MSKRNKFNRTWASQTVLGEEFGLSAIAIGQLFIEEGLKDKATKKATDKALNEGYARATPLKDGTPHFMWNIEKIRPLIAREHAPLDEITFWSRKTEATLKRASVMVDMGQDKLGFLLADVASDEIPTHIREAVIERTSHASPYGK